MKALARNFFLKVKVKLYLCLIKHHPLKTYEVVEVYLHLS
jgi:hypothetical protein